MKVCHIILQDVEVHLPNKDILPEHGIMDSCTRKQVFREIIHGNIFARKLGSETGQLLHDLRAEVCLYGVLKRVDQIGYFRDDLWTGKFLAQGAQNGVLIIAA